MRAEPATWNPLVALDEPSRTILDLIHAPLVRVHPVTQKYEGVLAKSWRVAPDGLTIEVELHSGVRFFNGDPLTAEDVVFTFDAFQDPDVGSPQRELLQIDGKSLVAEPAGETRVVFRLGGVSAAPLRLLTGVSILPHRLLAEAARERPLSEVWAIGSRNETVGGAGPFYLESYEPGVRLVLEANPHYWKKRATGRDLPALERLIARFATDPASQIARILGGELDLVSRLNPADYHALKDSRSQGGITLADAGPSLDYNFLLFNLNEPADGLPAERRRRREWLGDRAFRQAVSAAVDRQAVVEVAYRGLATAIWSPVTSANRYWRHEGLPRPERSLERARGILTAAGYSRSKSGRLLSPSGEPVAMSILASSSNAARARIGLLLESDLGELGVEVRLASLEYGSFLDRVLRTFDYDAALLGLGPNDIDPLGEINVWRSTGATHLWRLGEQSPATTWEKEIDKLLDTVQNQPDPALRKAAFDRVQEILSAEQPLVFLASPHLLAAHRTGLTGVRPTPLSRSALWNVEELRWK